jgi:dihydroorotate dehydrogenase (fumarate)
MIMVDISTTYLGMTLRSPLVVSANPLSHSLENLQRMDAAGAGAIVLYSLFEEQIRREREMMHHYLLYGTDSHPEALSYVPEPTGDTHTGTHDYLTLIEQAKQAVDVPVIASLNGTTLGSWTKFAKRVEDAGADAVELNIYNIPTDPDASSLQIEQGYIDIVQAVKENVRIPVAVKLSPFFTNFAHMAKRLASAGADGLVLFNRFYQPDIDLETLEVRPHVLLSTQHEQRLPLTWIGILYGRVGCDLAATTGVHTGQDAIKMLLAGANVTMMASVLLKQGIAHLEVIEAEMRQWLEANEYESVMQLQGSVSQMHAGDPSAFERAQYMRAVTAWPPRDIW